MMANKVRSQRELPDLKINIHKKVPPITNVIRKPNKLKMTDSLVATVPKTEVPNHVLNTKIYAKLQRNEIFEAAPAEVHFAGFEVDQDVKSYEQILRIINISGQIQRMTVLPPKTKFFDVLYVKPDRLVPGFALEIRVLFKPEEYKYYNDAIRIFSEGDENLYIPIHAYPIISSFDFPSKYKFPNLPIGKSLTRSFSLRSTAPIEFEYMIEVLQTNPAFHIEPLEGIIPYTEDAFINVTFMPKEFCTAVMTIQLIVSQFSSKPIVCSFYGSSVPGLDRDQVYNKLAAQYGDSKSNNRKTAYNNMSNDYDRMESSDNYYFNENENESHNIMLDPRQLSPLFVSRTKRTNINIGDSDNKDVAPKKANVVEYEGYQFPINLNAPWAVGKVLIQKKGKLSLKDLKSASKNSLKISAQAKEQIFLQRVTELEDEERRNQLKWQVKLGEISIEENARQEILQSRSKAVYEYQLSMGIPFLEQEINRQLSVSVDCRTVRPLNKLARGDIMFDTFKNKIWHLRYMALDKFIQGARKIVIKNRLVKVLNLLRKFINSWNEAINDSTESALDDKLTLDNYMEIYIKRLKGENLNQNELLKVISAKSMGTYYFPQVVEFREMQNQQARHCEKLSSIAKLDSLGLVAVKPIEFKIKSPTPFINLATPVLYKLNSYKMIHENQYVSKFENRLSKLRTGADDELTQIDSTLINAENKAKKVEEPFKEELKQEKNVQLPMPMTNSENITDESINRNKKIIDLIPSKKLSQPSEYSAMHIFNPAPSLVSYQKLLPYSGIELNHHLNPLPRFERDQTFSTQKRFIDHDDVIKGVMTWKKFPSQGLTSLSNTATLTDVWVPRWSNTFGTEILPTETPALLTGLPEDDKENLLDDSDEDQSGNVKYFLTPEIVNAQFNIPEIFETREKHYKEEIQFPLGEKLPQSNNPVSIFGQVPRFQREQELEYYLSKQCNTLGIRIQNKLISVENNFLMNQALNTNEQNNTNNINPSNIQPNIGTSLNQQSTSVAPSSALYSASTTSHSVTN